jgi:hypothetical protein
VSAMALASLALNTDGGGQPLGPWVQALLSAPGSEGSAEDADRSDSLAPPPRECIKQDGVPAEVAAEVGGCTRFESSCPIAFERRLVSTQLTHSLKPPAM